MRSSSIESRETHLDYNAEFPRNNFKYSGEVLLPAPALYELGLTSAYMDVL